MIAGNLKFRAGDSVRFKKSPYQLESMSVIRTNYSYLGVPVVQCKWYNTIRRRWEYETFEEYLLEYNDIASEIN